MKISAIDTFTLRVPTVPPIALDLPEHHLVVARIRPIPAPRGWATRSCSAAVAQTLWKPTPGASRRC